MYVCVVLGELHCPAPFKETLIRGYCGLQALAHISAASHSLSQIVLFSQTGMLLILSFLSAPLIILFRECFIVPLMLKIVFYL